MDDFRLTAKQMDALKTWHRTEGNDVLAQPKNGGSVYFCRLPSAVFLLPLWLACLLAIVGTVWRPLLASVGLMSIFLVLLVAIEWASRRLTIKKPKTQTVEPRDKTIVQQQMARSKTAEGWDHIEGTFWAEFPADTMTTTVHIPFCPAFEKVPKVQVFPVDDTDVNLRIVSPKMFGVRVDVKRNDLETRRICFAVVAEA